jgi:hypothetical protein
MRFLQSVKRAINRKIAHAIRFVLSPEIQSIMQVAGASVQKNPLLARPIRYFSQNEEDGMIMAIVERLGAVDPRVFVEFGVGNGLENNSIMLLATGWSGAWIGGQDLAFSQANSRLAFVKRWVTRDNAVSLATEGLAAVSASLDKVRIASMDLDGNDYHLVERLLHAGLKPELFIVEYNAKFPPPIEFVMPYDEGHRWQADDYFGASLASWSKLFAANAYRLAACNRTGSNAFFVHRRHEAAFADVPLDDLSALYFPGNYLVLPQSGHPTSPKTVTALIAKKRGKSRR